MTRGLSPKSVALSDQILATITEEGGLPISTPDLHRKISPYRPRAERIAAAKAGEYVPPAVPYSNMFRLLGRLADRGDIEKVVVRGLYVRYWRSVPDPQAADVLRDLEARL